MSIKTIILFNCSSLVEKRHKKSLLNLSEGFSSCRGRDRTSTEQLVVAQSSVVDPGRSSIATETALCYIYPVTSTPETRGHVCHAYAISSPHSICCFSKNLIEQIYSYLSIGSKISNKYFESIEIIQIFAKYYK